MTDERSLQELQGIVSSIVRNQSNPGGQVEPPRSGILSNLKPTVLLMQPSALQGQIWQAALVSQGVAVLWETAVVEPSQVIQGTQQAGLPLPDVLIVDTAILNQNPYPFCRWGRENCPQLKILLTNANQREISLPERQWAIYQGAQDLISGFQPETLQMGVTAALTRVLELIGLPLQQEALVRALAPYVVPVSAPLVSPTYLSPIAEPLLPATTATKSLSNPLYPNTVVTSTTAPASVQPLTPKVEKKVEDKRPKMRYRGQTY